MAEGSKGFRWSEVGGKRPCDGCGQVLRVEDVVVQTEYPKVGVFCRACFENKLWVAYGVAA